MILLSHFFLGRHLFITQTQQERLDGYEDQGGATTVADVVGFEIESLLETLTILDPGKNVNVSYFNQNGTDIIYTGSEEDKRDVKSIMWTIPFGQEFVVPLPDLSFELEGDAFPLQLQFDNLTPQLRLNWCFNFAFGIDEDDGE